MLLDLACFFGDVLEVFTVPTLNSLTRVTARQFGIVDDDHTDSIVEAPCVTDFPTTEFSLPFLLPSKPVSIVAETFPEVGAAELEVEKPSVKRARSSGTTHSVASVLQSVSDTDCLSMIRDIVGRTGVDFDSAETEYEIRGFLRAKLENARRGQYVT